MSDKLPSAPSDIPVFAAVTVSSVVAADVVVIVVAVVVDLKGSSVVPVWQMEALELFPVKT